MRRIIEAYVPQTQGLFAFDRVFTACQRQEMLSAVLATNIAALMAESPGLDTQRALAKRAGMDQRTVGRILNEEHSPNLLQVAKLAAAFDLLPWQLLVSNFDPTNPPMLHLSRAEASLYVKLRAIATDFGALPPK